MCIAIFSPKGNDIPCEEYLSNSFDNNSDGAGYAFNDRGLVHFKKGFMTWDAFKASFFKDASDYDFKNRGVLIHFRIGTHGGIVPECTHPFPLVDDEGMLKKLEGFNEFAVIHNGIISLTGAEAHKLQNMSDTMVFIQKYMMKIATNKNWFYNDSNWELIHQLVESKIACLNGEGEIKCTTGFTKDADGNFYSNTSYSYSAASMKSYLDWYNKGKSPKYSGYDYYDDYYGYGGYGGYYDDYYSKDSSDDYFMTHRAANCHEIVLDDGTILPYNKKVDYYISAKGYVYKADKKYGGGNLRKPNTVEFLGHGKMLVAKTKTEVKPYTTTKLFYGALKTTTTTKAKTVVDNKVVAGNYIPAHLLQVGEVVELSDSTEFYYDDDYPVFITRDGEVIAVDNPSENLEDFYINCPMGYIGDGVLVDSLGRPLEVTNSHMINLEQVDIYSGDYEDDFDDAEGEKTEDDENVIR